MYFSTSSSSRVNRDWVLQKDDVKPVQFRVFQQPVKFRAARSEPV